MERRHDLRALADRRVLLPRAAGGGAGADPQRPAGAEMVRGGDGPGARG